MRVILKKGKQRELLIESKHNRSWKELALLLKINENYLTRDIKNEKVSLDFKVYNTLCELSNKSFDKYIINKLTDNWGKEKGGRISTGNTKQIILPKKSNRLAEFYGIMLGDGNVTKIKGYKLGTYQIRIVGDSRYDKEYLLNFVKPLIEKLFGVKVNTYLYKDANALSLNAYGKKLVEFLENLGFKPGDKIKNHLNIPKWIKENKDYLKVCIRGLIDTDGSVHRMSKKDWNLIRINFRNYNKRLITDVRNGFITLNFHPSKIIHENIFYISRQSEVKKYLKEIGFSNRKHRDKISRVFSPVV